MAKSLETQLGEAREIMARMIAMGIDAQDRARMERRINALKAKIQRATADNASVAASADSLARELNVSVLDLCRALGKGAGPATRLSSRETAILRTVHGR
jgi:light-regulated signal transduction histidine kinase (bacteriophytochrome)